MNLHATDILRCERGDVSSQTETDAVICLKEEDRERSFWFLRNLSGRGRRLGVVVHDRRGCSGRFIRRLRSRHARNRQGEVVVTPRRVVCVSSGRNHEISSLSERVLVYYNCGPPLSASVVSHFVYLSFASLLSS